MLDVKTYDFNVYLNPWQPINITPRIVDLVRSVRNGIVNVFTPSEDCAVVTIEYDPHLFNDLKKYLEEYLKVRGIRRLASSILGRCITLPIVNSSLRLGAWQQIVLINIGEDPKEAQIYVTITGES
ncbi:MAG: YjbQ family protein [Thermoprotei archaeon]|nr:YjbQ family protein [Thermoprotei archaeon]